jgi:hypothetical protein
MWLLIPARHHPLAELTKKKQDKRKACPVSF